MYMYLVLASWTRYHFFYGDMFHVVLRIGDKNKNKLFLVEVSFVFSDNVLIL